MSIKHSDDLGFATVELIVTLIVIGLIFSAFIGTFTTIQNLNKKSSDIQKANNIGFEKSQEYENMAFASIPGSGAPGSLVEVEDFSSQLSSTIPAPRVGKVFVDNLSPTLKHIVINVEFGQNATKQSVQYVNFIQRNGVGR